MLRLSIVDHWMDRAKLQQKYQKLLMLLGVMVMGVSITPSSLTPPQSAPPVSHPANSYQTSMSPHTYLRVRKALLVHRTKEPAQAKSPAPIGHIYRIQWGQSLWALARQFHMTPLQLQEANHLTTDQIIAGHSLVIPHIYTVADHESLQHIATQFGVPLLLLWHENRLQTDKLTAGQQLVIPYTGSIPSPVNTPHVTPVSTSNPNAQLASDISHANHRVTASEVALMAHLVHAEAGNQPFLGQVAVAAVLLNRTHAPGFPPNVQQIIFQPGQFESVSNGSFWNKPSHQSYMAVKAALRGWDPTHGALYFYNPNLPHVGWMNGLPVTTVIGNQVFCQ